MGSADPTIHPCNDHGIEARCHCFWSQKHTMTCVYFTNTYVPPSNMIRVNMHSVLVQQAFNVDWSTVNIFGMNVYPFFFKTTTEGNSHFATITALHKLCLQYLCFHVPSYKECLIHVVLGCSAYLTSRASLVEFPCSQLSSYIHIIDEVCQTASSKTKQIRLRS